MAALTLTYDDGNSRVLCSATSLASTVDVALFESSTDQIHWTTVRGGAAVTVAANAAQIYDYEFSPNIINYYRVSAVDTALPSFVASSTPVNAVNASVTPALPVGWAEGDLLVIFATIRNSGAGRITVPAGWTAMLQVDNIALLGRRATTSESAPAVSVTGGVAGADVIAQMIAVRNAELVPASASYQLNPSGANVTYPGLPAVESTWGMALYLAWKQSAWTSVATIAGATAEIGDSPSSAGTGASLGWDYQLMGSPVAITQGAFTVTGGSSAISYGANVALRSADYVTRTVNVITPNMTLCWLKFPLAPYCNRTITLIDWAEIQRTSRTSFYTVVNQREAIASTDTHVPRTVSINLFTFSDAERTALDLVLSIGQTVLLHVTSNVSLGSMYAGLGNYTFLRPAHLSHRGTYTIPLTETAAPDPSLPGNLVSWATLITNYATWQDVINANATWTAVLALTGTPTDATVSM